MNSPRASNQTEKLKGAHAIQVPTICKNLDPKCKPLQKMEGAGVVIEDNYHMTIIDGNVNWTKQTYLL